MSFVTLIRKGAPEVRARCSAPQTDSAPSPHAKTTREREERTRGLMVQQEKRYPDFERCLPRNCQRRAGTSASQERVAGVSPERSGGK